MLTNETGIVVKRDPDTVCGADVLFISYRRLKASQRWRGFLRQPPELVVEVLAEDDSWKKIEAKVAEYHSFGVDLVWIADPKTLSVRVYPRGDKPTVCPKGGELSGGRALPGFRCKVARFFTT